MGRGAAARPKARHWRRYAVALVLLALTYGLAVLLGVGMLAAAAFLLLSGRSFVAAAFLGYLGGALLWALRPLDEPPPPEPDWSIPLARADLTALVEEVAATMRTTAPPICTEKERVASLRRDGGFHGIGGQSVLVLGIPTITLIPVEELRAIVAHELGHEVGRDHRISRVMFASSRALHRMHDEVESHRWIAWVAPAIGFVGERVARMVMAMRRDRELVADEWAAFVAGPDVAASALRSTHALDIGVEAFFDFVSSMVPLGVLPENLVDALREYEGSHRWTEAVERVPFDEDAQPFDTHPTVPVRLERLGTAAEPIGAGSHLVRLAADEASEIAWSDEVIRLSGFAHLPREPWPVARERLFEVLRNQAFYTQHRFPELTWGGVAALVADWERCCEAAGRLVRGLIGYRWPDRDEQVNEIVGSALTCYCASLLEAAGWQPEVHAGDRTAMVRDGERIVPNAIFTALLRPEPPDARDLEHLAAIPLEAGARVDVPVDVGKEIEEALTSPFVRLRSADGVGVRGPADQLAVPMCCPVCLGTATEVRHLAIASDIELPVVACEAHVTLLPATVWGRAESKGVVSLATNILPWGDLLLACNGLDRWPALPVQEATPTT